MSNLMATLKPYLDECGLWVVFGVTLLENLGVPMPGQTILIAGALPKGEDSGFPVGGHRLIFRLETNLPVDPRGSEGGFHEVFPAGYEKFYGPRSRLCP